MCTSGSVSSRCICCAEREPFTSTSRSPTATCASPASWFHCASAPQLRTWETTRPSGLTAAPTFRLNRSAPRSTWKPGQFSPTVPEQSALLRITSCVLLLEEEVAPDDRWAIAVVFDTTLAVDSADERRATAAAFRTVLPVASPAAGSLLPPASPILPTPVRSALSADSEVFATLSGRASTGPERRMCNSAVSHERRDAIILGRSPSMPLTPMMHILGRMTRSHRSFAACCELCCAMEPVGTTSIMRSSWTSPLLGFLNVKPNSLPPFLIDTSKCGGKRITLMCNSGSSKSSFSMRAARRSPLTCKTKSPEETSTPGCAAFHFASAPALLIWDTITPLGPTAMPHFLPNTS
mmetsp:Transcript_9750/g.27295  ORF Transcript_9750/g.27295 Transcript_9750/m.27295 type:complete len:351 (-) Transcript_9750:473-1525(-)